MKTQGTLLSEDKRQWLKSLFSEQILLSKANSRNWNMNVWDVFHLLHVSMEKYLIWLIINLNKYINQSQNVENSWDSLNTIRY